MFTKRTLLTAGAAMVGLLVGITAARAVWNLDEDRGAFVVAKETVTETQTVSSDTLYVFSTPTTGTGSTRLNVRAQLGVQIAASATRYVRFNLVNMALTSASAPSLALTGATATSAGGGSAGDNFVAFTVTAGGTAVPASTEMTLTLRVVAVEEGARGDVRMQVRGATGSTPVEHTADISGAIGLESALRESATPAVARSLAGEGFRKFESGGNVRGDGLAASVGWFSISAANRSSDDMLMVNATSTPITMDDTGLGRLISRGGSTVTVAGNTSYAKTVFWSDTPACTSPTTSGNRLLDSGAVATTSVEEANGKHFCIEVDGVTPIPRTDPYRVTIDYQGIASAQFPPDTAVLTLGSIARGGGAAVRIPYLTTFSRFNHRIVVTYLGSEPVGYEFVLEAENVRSGRDTTPTPRSLAKGMLQPGVTNFRTNNLVEFVGGAAGWTRTGVTLFVDTSPDLLSVISNQVNVETGATDTAEYEVE